MATDTILPRRTRRSPDPQWVAAMVRAETETAWRMARYYRAERNKAMADGDLEEANRYERWRLVDLETFKALRRIDRLARRLTEEAR